MNDGQLGAPWHYAMKDYAEAGAPYGYDHGALQRWWEEREAGRIEAATAPIVRRVWHLLDATTRRGFWSLDWEVKGPDCWVGAFWRTYRDEAVWELDVWVCLLPCLPLHLYITRRHESEEV